MIYVAQSVVFCVVVCRSLFVLLSFSVWPLYCLFFDLRFLITPLVYSNFSYGLGVGTSQFALGINIFTLSKRIE